MSQISLFFLEFFIFLVAIVSIPIFFYDIVKTLIDNISNCFLIFDQEKIKDIAFFIEEKEYKYLLGYFCFINLKLLSEIFHFNFNKKNIRKKILN